MGITGVTVSISSFWTGRPVFGVLYALVGVAWLAGHFRQWRWTPRRRDALLLTAGMLLAWILFGFEVVG
ncbi:hypothetical protein GCM10008957_43200 [Deinococcus ruber]|uniref:Uncharacterized protein n=2 Tax=Deinococcus ruber TaxID=1848197 RepID=A0A918FE55_9DEIO|nr:hypothetical protein GCM10008957_43200 [Deinococcus ruber]